MMRVLRESSSGEIVVEVGGQTYRHLTYIARPEERQQVLAAVAALQRFASGVPRAPKAAGRATSVEEAPPTEEDFLEELAVVDRPPEKPTLRSFVDQIDDVLQLKLREAHISVEGGVHVKEGPGGDLEFIVGYRVYESLDQVPDADVRNLIRAAVQEWDRLH